MVINTNRKVIPTYEESLIALDTEIEQLKSKKEELINELTHTQEHLMSSLDWRAKLRVIKNGRDVS